MWARPLALQQEQPLELLLEQLLEQLQEQLLGLVLVWEQLQVHFQEQFLVQLLE